MAANAWFRMYSEFVSDPKVQMLSEKDQRRYIMVLCMRCGNGDVTLQDEEVAFQLRISNEDWAETKSVLTGKKLIDERNTPTAWGKRQYESDSSKERVSKHRAKKKKGAERACNVTVTPPDTDTDTDTDTEEEKAESKERRASAPPTTKKSPKGSRLDLDWVLPDDWAVEARDVRAKAGLPPVDVGREADQFRDYWHAKAGREGVKADWRATWRNWVRTARASAVPAKGGFAPLPADTSDWNPTDDIRRRELGAAA